MSGFYRSPFADAQNYVCLSIGHEGPMTFNISCSCDAFLSIQIYDYTKACNN